jgi:BolA protein
MSIHEQTRKEIETILQTAFSPSWLQVIDDSGSHAGHQEAMMHPTAGHFKVSMVSEAFVNQSAVARHRMVYQKLGALMDSRIHAISLDLRAAGE